MTFAGYSKVTKAADRIGLVVGLPIDISFTGELDLRLVRVVSWITYMLSSNHLKSARSKLRPFGHDTADEQTRTGNILALRALKQSCRSATRFSCRPSSNNLGLG